jgi:hypothetical protein
MDATTFMQQSLFSPDPMSTLAAKSQQKQLLLLP